MKFHDLLKNHQLPEADLHYDITIALMKGKVVPRLTLRHKDIRGSGGIAPSFLASSPDTEMSGKLTK
jgi:hypothetical protein